MSIIVLFVLNKMEQINKCIFKLYIHELFYHLQYDWSSKQYSILVDVSQKMGMDQVFLVFFYVLLLRAKFV